MRARGCLHGVILARSWVFRRGTIKTAYDRLSDDQLVVSKGAAGTFVSSVLPAVPEMAAVVSRLPLPDLYQDLDSVPKLFQVGVPSSGRIPL